VQRHCISSQQHQQNHPSNTLTAAYSDDADDGDDMVEALSLCLVQLVLNVDCRGVIQAAWGVPAFIHDVMVDAGFS
jgi:hypothetical protein